MNPILIRPRPFTEESLAGYLLRLANRNGQPFRHLLSDLGESSTQYTLPMQFAYGRRSLERLSDALRLDAGVLEALVYRPHRRRGPRAVNVDYWGVDLPIELMAQACAPFCPQCLAEDEVRDHRSAFFRATWDSRLQPVCNRHGCLLSESCPDCGRQVTWERRRLLYCPCHDGRDADAQRGQLSRARVVRAEPIHLPEDPLQQRKIALLAMFMAMPMNPTFTWSDLADLPIEIRARHLAAAAKALRAGQDAVNALIRRGTEARWKTGGALGSEWLILPLRQGIKGEDELNRWAAEMAERHCIKRPRRTRKLLVRGLTVAEAAALLRVGSGHMRRIVRSLAKFASPEGTMIEAYSLANWIDERDRAPGQNRMRFKSPTLSLAEKRERCEWDLEWRDKQYQRWESKRERAKRNAIVGPAASSIDD